MVGRVLSPVWDHYKKIMVSGRKGCRAMCLYCSKMIEGQVKRLNDHLKSCSNYSSSDSKTRPNMLDASEVSSVSSEDNKLKSLGMHSPTESESISDKEQYSESSMEEDSKTSKENSNESITDMEQCSESSSDSSDGMNNTPRKVKIGKKVEKMLALAKMFRKKNLAKKRIFLKKRAKGDDLELIYEFVCDFLETGLPGVKISEESRRLRKEYKTLVYKLGSKPISNKEKRKILSTSDGVEIVKLMFRFISVYNDKNAPPHLQKIVNGFFKNQ